MNVYTVRQETNKSLNEGTENEILPLYSYKEKRTNVQKCGILIHHENVLF